jgi:pSer/pThr/pTyr-binding forkhead associated (FHA) protein
LQPKGKPVDKGLNLTVLAGPRRGQRYRVASPCVIGRTRGTLLFPEDPFISPQHASLSVRQGRVLLRDDGSVSGVFVAIAGQEAISPSSYFCAGQRLFRYLGAIASPATAPSEVIIYGAPVPEGSQLYAVEELLAGGRSGRATLSGQPVTIGRLDCDLSFPGDEGLALRHCELAPSAPGAILRDLSAGLGTFVRLAPGVERVLKAGDQVRIGQAVLLLESVE